MRLPIIKLQDNCTKKQFVATDKDIHNYLYADKEGIQYYNLQNGEGTSPYEDSGYSFVGEEGYMGIDVPMLDMIDILRLYHSERIESLNCAKLNLEFDELMGRFKALDMRVEDKLKERSEMFKKKMLAYAEAYLQEN